MMNPKSKFVMIQGTSSSAGKSTLTAGFLRYFSDRGISCSPFKPQNMSLNSFVTEDGFEIAVSQAVQSEAAFKKPIRQINPILIKPASDLKMHLIVEGKYYGNMNFKKYNGGKDFFLKKAMESFEFLTSENELVVLEGAGSPAEINLFKYDIANMGFAGVYDIPVILAADIERGGVFASIYGTVKLIPPKWRKLIKGFVINKFRGDVSILEPGIRCMERRLKIPCLGVLPYIKNLHIEAEDSLDLKNSGSFGKGKNGGRLKIGIVRLDHISNFNEFDPLFFDDRIAVRFFDCVPADEDEFDMIIIPGSKSTVSDLSSLKRSKIFDYIKKIGRRSIIMGICGGFQMMGKRIEDPLNIESGISMTEGFGFFKTVTVLSEEKILLNRKYRFNNPESSLSGYEIHNGRTFFAEDYSSGDAYADLFKLETVKKRRGNILPENGISSKDGKKMGTYIHGLFGNTAFKDFIVGIAGKHIKFGHDGGEHRDYDAVKNESFNLLSKNIEEYVDIKTLRDNIIAI